MHPRPSYQLAARGAVARSPEPPAQLPSGPQDCTPGVGPLNGKETQ